MEERLADSPISSGMQMTALGSGKYRGRGLGAGSIVSVEVSGFYGGGGRSRRACSRRGSVCSGAMAGTAGFFRSHS